ncbi:O-methylsterigmatocystin oxidoreductase [Penicillium subrubescens]|uniref:O-methylsterigmatocystin oxidoreductase n=1 Tax=Penicillium subrubescens TaxID=1316194 RepID=A0A1Q5U047_9EURO|nr:O-methylsterigmatocystin oxidoreductase [Penicillium subrubescens]
MQTYSDRFRVYRKAMQPYLGSETAIAQYNSLQEIEVHRFLLRVLLRFLQDPSKLSQHVQTEAGAVILKIAYGYSIEQHTRDPLVDMANLALERFSLAGTPVVWLVDMVPIREFYLHSTYDEDLDIDSHFYRQEWKKQLENVVDKPYAFVQRRMNSGKFQPSYLSNLFKASGYPLVGSEEEIIAKWTAGSLYTGGADTTVSSIETFFLAMTLFPGVQRKAQEEIDQVLGGRLPTVADRGKLPYADAIVKEALRWHPVAPMGIPHVSVEDDLLNGFYIPKGSLIMPNIWALTHDSEVYHDPMVFKPERFLGIDGREPEMDPHAVVFGFGRRVCPVSNVDKACEDGKEVEVKPEFQAGVISHPVPWKFNVTTRSPAHEALILTVEKEHPWEESDAPDLENVSDHSLQG